MIYELIFGVVVILSGLAIVGAVIRAIWLDHEDAKREAEHRKPQCQDAFGMGGQLYRCSLPEGHEGGHAYNNAIMGALAP